MKIKLIESIKEISHSADMQARRITNHHTGKFMNRDSIYNKQVQLLVRVLPRIAEEDCFALKGGTAINLFYRDMPRLSVDIDLHYIPMDDRDTALENIRAALSRISDRIRKAFSNVTVQNAHET